MGSMPKRIDVELKTQGCVWVGSIVGSIRTGR